MVIQIKKSSLLFLFFIISALIFGQSNDFIQGKILDSSTKKPISFTSIILKQNRLGLYASEEGDFKIRIRPSFLSDTIMISCIGFNKKEIKFKELDADSINYII